MVEETEVVVDSVEVVEVGIRDFVEVAGVGIQASVVVEGEVGNQVSVVVEGEVGATVVVVAEAGAILEEAAETLEVEEVASTVGGVEAVGAEVPENREGTWPFLPIFPLILSEYSVFAENIPATLDARLTDKSQDELIADMKKMTIRPSDLPQRPDFGTVGPSFKMRTNFFPIKLPRKTLFEYDITITPGVAIKRVKRRIFQLAEATDDWTKHGLRGNVAHDFASKLVAVTKLPDPLVIKIIFVDEDEDVKEKKQKPKEYTLTFKFVKDLDTSNLIEYVYLYSPADVTA